MLICGRWLCISEQGRFAQTLVPALKVDGTEEQQNIQHSNKTDQHFKSGHVLGGLKTS